jgi:hypothetical protein
VLSGTHAAGKIQLSTWAHVVIAGKASSLGFTSHSRISPHPCIGTNLEFPDDPYDSLEVCHPSRFMLTPRPCLSCVVP